jgi:hypothetical protein
MGTGKQLHEGFPPETGTPRSPIDHVNATVVVAAYSDGTADTQNQEAFERLLSVRKGRMLATQERSPL